VLQLYSITRQRCRIRVWLSLAASPLSLQQLIGAILVVSDIHNVHANTTAALSLPTLGPLPGSLFCNLWNYSLWTFLTYPSPALRST
jgi:hypothetical protein